MNNGGIRMYRVMAPFIMLFLVACATTPPPPPPLTDADYGPYPTNYEETIKAYFDKVLKDPFSAQYRFKEPYKGITRHPPIMGSGFKQAGWFVEFDYNAKNSFGAYTGWQSAQFFFKDGRIIDTFGVPISWPKP